MQEKFYCVGCKNHYELNLTGLERKPSKGGSFRYAMKSVCPEGHRTSKICNEDDFADYADYLELCPKCGSKSWYEEETDHAYHYDCSCSDCGHTEWKEVDGPDYDDYDDPRYEAEELRIVPLDIKMLDEKSYQEKKDNRRVADCGGGYRYATEPHDWKSMGEQKVLISYGETPYSYNQQAHLRKTGQYKVEYTKEELHEYSECTKCGLFGPVPLSKARDWKSGWEAEGMTVGVNLEALAPTADEPESGVALVPEDSLMPEGSGRTIGSQSVSHNYTPFHAEEYCDEYCEENGGHCASCCEHPSCEISDICVLHCDGDYHSGPCMVDGEEYEVDFDAEEFIAHRRLKDHLLSIMPDKVYGVKDLGDGDFEMRVADRYMDDVIEAVSEYQISESDSDSFFLGQSKSTVAAVAAVAALGLAFWYNRK